MTGWDADPGTLQEAVGAKALDASAGSLAEAVAGVELVVVAVPVGVARGDDPRGARRRRPPTPR